MISAHLPLLLKRIKYYMKKIDTLKKYIDEEADCTDYMRGY